MEEEDGEMYLGIKVPVEQNESLETRDGDAKIGFYGQGPLEELVVNRPVRGHGVFGDGRDGVVEV